MQRRCPLAVWAFHVLRRVHALANSRGVGPRDSQLLSIMLCHAEAVWERQVADKGCQELCVNASVLCLLPGESTGCAEVVWLFEAALSFALTWPGHAC